MNIIFDSKNIYYLPQYLPIIEQLHARGHSCQVVIYLDKNQHAEVNLDRVIPGFAALSIDVVWVKNEAAALAFYLVQKPDWIFFGNQFANLDQIHVHSKTAQLGHGIGPKPSYYRKSKTPMTVRFMEGAERLQKIKTMFPDNNFIQVGYSKMDPIFSKQEKGLDLASIGLDPARKTLLYAPTFNPSSIECFPDNWPELFPEYNILIKAHAFTYQRKRYRRQRKKLACWEKYPNTYIAGENEVSLLPFMVSADLLISEASSTLFEFAALDRPVIVCNFYYLKWLYRGPFKYRFERRFQQNNVFYKDIGAHIDSFDRLTQAVSNQLENPQQFAAQRENIVRKHVGPTDGKTSERIVDYLEQ